MAEASERERSAAWVEEQAMSHARAHYAEGDDEVPALLTLADVLAHGLRAGEHLRDASDSPLPLFGGGA